MEGVGYCAAEAGAGGIEEVEGGVRLEDGHGVVWLSSWCGHCEVR